MGAFYAKINARNHLELTSEHTEPKSLQGPRLPLDHSSLGRSHIFQVFTLWSLPSLDIAGETFNIHMAQVLKLRIDIDFLNVTCSQCLKNIKKMCDVIKRNRYLDLLCEAENTLECVCVGVCVRGGVYVRVRKVPVFLTTVEHTICVCVGVQNCSALRCVRKQHVAF